DAARVKSPYFRLLARDPDALEARTRTDKDIFYNPDGGLPRAERELAAAATSRFNGCLYCASVHARHAATYSKREDDVQRLLDAGVTADLGERWNAIVAASVALTATPSAFGPEHVARLRRPGLGDRRARGRFRAHGAAARACHPPPAAAAANQNPPASSTVARATVYASRVPCHRLSSHCLS